MKTKIFRAVDETRLQKSINDWFCVAQIKPGDIKFITQSEAYGSITIAYHYVSTKMEEVK